MRSSDYATKGSSRSRASVWVIVWLVAIFALALFLRVYWNVDPATADGNFILSGGPDPYYHKHAIDCIQIGGCAPGQDPWTTLGRDPMLNYPAGSINVNPPLFEWSIAVMGAILAPFLGGITNATWWATLSAPAVFGALTIFPIYIIGAELFNRRTGIIAGLLWALSTSSIDHSSFGAADHDAAVMFFITLGMMFYLKAIHGLRGDTKWVANWSDATSRHDGMRRLFAERKLSFAFAMLAGLSLAAVALIWKGFPYMAGILIIYALVQMLVDHWRNRDSLALFAATFITLAVGLLFGSYWYIALGLSGFFTPVLVMFIGFVFVSLMIVPTRDLPSILVFPLFAGAGVITAALVYLVLPTIWRSLFYALVYIRQNALYQTISEAQGADFNQISFAFGPVVFIFAIIGLAMLLWTGRKSPKRDTLFTAVWAIVALVMAIGAVRFLFNAVPIVAVLAAWATERTVAWFDFGRAKRRFQQASGNFMKRFGKGVGWSRALSAVALVLALVVPTVFLGVEAATPSAYDRKIANDLFVAGDTQLAEFYAKHFGYFGQSYLENYWTDSLTFLDKWDDPAVSPVPARYSAWAARPAFLAWWDYGHYAISVGKHPAVADNFQNGYAFAANYLLAQSENESIQLLASRITPLLTRDQALAAIGSGIAGAASAPSATAVYDALTAPESKWRPMSLSVAESAKLLAAIEAVAKTKEGYPASIRYIAADVRMMPVDQFLPLQYRSALDNVDYGSIFPAPVTLKFGGDTDAVERYTQTIIEVQDNAPVGQESAQLQQGVRYMTPEEYGALAERPAGRGVRVTGSYLCFKETFWDSMFFRAYNGNQPPATPAPDFVNCQQFGGGLTSNQVTGIVQAGAEPRVGFASPDSRFAGANPPAPARGLTHYRLAYLQADASGTVEVSIIEYVPGATISGAVVEQVAGGASTATVDAVVVAYDDAGRLIYPTLTGPKKAFYDATGAKKPLSAIDFPAISGLVADGGFDYLREGLEATTQRLRNYYAELPATLNVPHASVRTDNAGEYSLVVPYGNVTVVAFEPDAQGRATTVELSRSNIVVTREQASSGHVFSTPVDISVKPAILTGRLFFDADGDGVRGANESYPASADANVSVSNQGVVVGPTGEFTTPVRAGVAVVTVDAVGYEAVNAPLSIQLQGGASVTRDIALRVQTTRTVTGTTTFTNGNGTAVPAPAGTVITFASPALNQTQSALVNADGGWTVRLTSGDAWIASSSFQDDDGTTHAVEDTMNIATETAADRGVVTWAITYTQSAAPPATPPPAGNETAPPAGNQTAP